MFSKNTITISAGAFALALLGACSNDKSVAGATVDPDTFAHTNSIEPDNPGSSNSESAAPIINFSLKPSSTIALKNGSISVYDEEKGASGLCAIEGMSYASKIQVYKGIGLNVVTTLEFKGNSDVCNDLYEEFKNECESKKGNFVGADKDCERGDFYIWCQYSGGESDSVNTILNGFFAKMGDACSELTEGAEYVYGEYEMPSSASKGDADVTPTSSASDDPIDIPPEDIDKYTQYPSDMEDGEVDVPSTGKFVGTLDQYTAQFTDDPTELSFDSHVLAYNGQVPMKCRALDSGIDDLDLNSSIKKIEKEQIADCFPMTAEAMELSGDTKKCDYYVVASPDGSQPTGHAITKVSKDGVEIASIITGGMCMLSQAFFDVIFLIEDCDGIVSESSVLSRKTFTSSTWACEEGSYSPTKEAKAYGEWFRADLLK